MAGAPRGACAADGGTNRGARPRGSSGEARRPHWLCYVLLTRGGKWGSGPRISRPPRRFHACAAGRAHERAGRERAPLPRRGAHLGTRAVDDAAPHRHRWLLRGGALAAAMSLRRAWADRLAGGGETPGLDPIARASHIVSK